MRQQNFCFAKLWLVFPVAAVFVLAFGIPIASAQGFDPGCTVPFDAIKEHHPIDDSCSIEGVGASDAHLAQNRAKNNFCAAAPIRISYNSFLRLQRGAEQKDIPFGSSNSLPEDRSVLRDLYTTSTGVKLGEGSLVQYVAFIIDAHHSNTSKGESVNCKKGGKENNDIHVALGRSPDEDPCDSITAEISPHLRPSAWEFFGDGWDSILEDTTDLAASWEPDEVRAKFPELAESLGSQIHSRSATLQGLWKFAGERTRAASNLIDQL